MSDVEKYGLFAVVFVGGLLLVIALQGGFSGDETPAAAGAPVVITGDVPLSAPVADGARPPSRVRVKSIMPDTPFEWSEPPIAYPGERSSAAPAASAAEPPAQPPAPAGPPVALAPTGMHVIAPGDTLSAIATRYLGNESRWKELVKLNPGLDPKNLKLGQQIRVSGAAPAAAAASPPAAPPAAGPVRAPAGAATAGKSGRTHTVVKGDTLGAIAKKYLGSTARADDIYAANRDVLKSKDDLALGQVLAIP